MDVRMRSYRSHPCTYVTSDVEVPLRFQVKTVADLLTVLLLSF